MRGAVALLALIAAEAAAQGDGARNYQLLPEGSRSVTLFAVGARANQPADSSTVTPGAKIEASLAVVQYSRAAAVDGRQVQLFAALPYGRVKGTAPTSAGTLSADESGLGDAALSAFVGLIGAPSLGERDYAQYEPRFMLGVLGRIIVPTGEYEASSPINMGANRWALQLGAPMARYFGRSLADASLGSLELTPSMTAYTSNNNPHNANTVQQDPLFKLEGHITRNLSRPFWLSADTLYQWGGETTTDGVRDGNRQRSLGLGATAGYAFTDTIGASVTYGKVVKRNAAGLEARGLRADAIIAF